MITFFAQPHRQGFKGYVMVNWYKHDIPAWMDGTEALDAEPYRTYHVICQLIYLNEGPIALNEHGIAGRCKQSIRTFRASLKTLLDLGKLTLSDGRLDNSRAEKELENVSENRVNASKGGKKSAEVRNLHHKSLKNNDQDQATLQNIRSLKTREDETREDKKDGTKVPIVNLFPMDDSPPSEEKSYFARSREILGKSAGGVAKKLLTAKKGIIAEARAAVEMASTKHDPMAYVQGAIRGAASKSEGVYGVDWW